MTVPPHTRTTSPAAMGTRRTGAGFAGVFGTFGTIITAIALLTLGSWVLGSLAASARNNDLELPNLAVMILDNRVWVGVLALPSLACGIAAAFLRNWRWALLSLGGILLIPPAAMIGYATFAIVAPFYELQPL